MSVDVERLECPTCGGSEWTDNGCGVVRCPECSVSASTYLARLAQAEAERVRLREAARNALMLFDVEVPHVGGERQASFDRAASDLRAALDEATR